MRGKAYADEGDIKNIGITPAYAGKSPLIGFDCTLIRDHPRVCGEKCHSLFLAASAEGSPPRMRGKASTAL